MSFVKTFVVVSIVVAVMDGIWLSFLAEPMYTTLRKILNTSSSLPLNIYSAAAAYFSMILSLVLLTVPRVSRTHRIQDSIFWGIVWGIGVYGTFNFTNLAIIGKYPLWIGIIDLLWGCFIGSVATYIGSLI